MTLPLCLKSEAVEMKERINLPDMSTKAEKVLQALRTAGPKGIVAAELPPELGLRLATYISVLRRHHCVAITTKQEPYGDHWHGRYFLTETLMP